MMRPTGHTPGVIRAIAAIACLAALVAFTPSDVRADEIKVADVEVEGLHSIGQEELLYLLEIREGETIDGESVRRGIKRAFMKGIFEDIVVERDESREGFIRVKVEERHFIAGIRVEGAENVGSRFIRKQLGLATGDEMRFDLIEAYEETVADVLRQKGYHNARVSLEVRETRRPNRVRLIFRVEEGMPTHIREIVVLGRPASEVLPLMRTYKDSVFDQFRLRKDIENLTRYYKKKGYLNPVVGPFTFSAGVLHLNVNPGRRLEIRIEGNDSVGDGKLTRVAPFFDAGDIRDDLIDEAIARMTSVYHSRGFPSVEIATVMSTEGDTVILTFFVYEGPKVRVGRISLEGVSVSGEHLKQVLALREGGIYNPDLLDRDVQHLKDFYNSLGYINVSVSEPEVEIEDSLAKIVIHVNEGIQFVITGVDLKGVVSLPVEEVLSGIGIEQGAPYNELDISDARRSITSLYRKRGFQSVEVNVQREFDGEGGVKVSFVVDEGPKLYFGRTVVRGNDSVKLEVVRREFEHREGYPLNKAILLEERQRIFKTGLFSDVDIELADRYDHKSDVIVDLREGKAGTVEFGLGYGEYDRFRGFFDISYKNLFGMNRQGAFRVEASSLLTRYIIRYNEPWFLERRFPLRTYFVKEDRKEINIDTGDVKYKVERYTAGVGVEKELSDRVKLDLLYEYSFTDTLDVAPDIILTREDTGTLGISSITPSLTYDSRDNPYDPRRGVYAGVSLKTATVVLLSETDFFKLEAFASGFKELAKRVVFAASARGGLAQGVRDTTDLPLVERFFLGGRNTVRGFAQDDLGPKGPQGNPIGGNVFFLGNLEFRFRITKSWRIVTFFDTGQVWLDDEDVDFSDLRYTAGLGLQYNTPVGPIRLDYGIKLDRREGESQAEVHFSIGHAF